MSVPNGRHARAGYANVGRFEKARTKAVPEISGRNCSGRCVCSYTKAEAYTTKRLAGLAAK